MLPAEPFPGVEQLLASLNEAAPAAAYLAGFHAGPIPAPRCRAPAPSWRPSWRRSAAAASPVTTAGSTPASTASPPPGRPTRIPAAFACFGSRERIEADAALIEATLRAATKPGATAQDVLDAASAVRSPSS